MLAARGDLGFGLNEIEWWILPGIDTHLVLPCQLLGELERLLLNGNVRQSRLEGPIRLLHRRDGLDRRFAESEIGAFEVPLRDDELLPRRINRPVLEQRLGVRDLKPRLKAGI